MEAIAWTWLTFRFEPRDEFLNMVFCTTVNTVIRFGAIYLLIRVGMTAISHGSF